MKKNIVLLLLTVLVVQFCICSCTYYTEDPFLTETETDIVTSSEETAETVTKPEGPDDDFYTLTDKQSYDKYGWIFPSLANCDNYTDGTTVYFLTNVGSEEEPSYTIGRTAFPLGSDKTITPVCTNPLCKHTAGSGCPFSGWNFPVVAIFADHLYYATIDGKICVYEFYNNIKTELIEGCLVPRFYKDEDNLYLQYNAFNEESLQIEKVYVKITPDGKLTELGRRAEEEQQVDFLYKDRYVILDEYLPDEKKAVINLYDLSTAETKTLCEFEYENLSTYEYLKTNMKYKDKLLIETKYYKKGSGNKASFALYTVDLNTGEKELICTPDYETYKTDNVQCLFSRKCILWYDPRESEDDPFIVQIYFPDSGERETYNLSEMAAKAGCVIPLNDYMSSMKTGAVTLQRFISAPDGSFLDVENTFVLDLTSEKLFKYEYKKPVAYYKTNYDETTKMPYFTLYIYYPESDEVIIYDLSKMAAAKGQEIPVDNYKATLDNNTVTLTKTVEINGVMQTEREFTYELENKYIIGAPAA